MEGGGWKLAVQMGPVTFLRLSQMFSHSSGVGFQQGAKGSERQAALPGFSLWALKTAAISTGDITDLIDVHGC